MRSAIDLTREGYWREYFGPRPEAARGTLAGIDALDTPEMLSLSFAFGRGLTGYVLAAQDALDAARLEAGAP